MKKFFIACVMLVASSVTAWADSPITSTDWAKAYQDVPIVAKMLALNGQTVTTELIEYLADDNNPADVKVAAINAVSFDKDTYTPLMNLLKAKFGTESEISVLGKISPSTHIALAYAQARLHYMNPQEAGFLSYTAVCLAPESLTANVVYALVMANYVMSAGDWGAVYQICDAVRTSPKLQQDMRPQAITMLMEYIDGYKAYIKTTN